MGFSVLFGAQRGYAVSTATGGLGLEPVWDLAASEHVRGVDLAWAVVAGLLGAAIGVAFTVMVEILHRLASYVPTGTRPILGAAVALVTGWRGGFIPLFFAGFTLGWAVADWLPIEHDVAFIAATMVGANVAVTKTPIGSTFVVTKWPDSRWARCH